MIEKPQKTSKVIAEIVEDCVEDGAVTVAEFLEKMGHKALSIVILVLSISAVIAGVIPGFSTLMAVPIMFIAMQMVLGRNTIYLPKNIREKLVSPKHIRGALAQSIPTLRWVEKFLRPRLVWLTTGIGERVIAAVILVLACILALPIPAGNFLPSFTISLLALAMLERDGVLLLLTIGTLFFTGALMVDLIVAAFQYASQLLQGIF